MKITTSVLDQEFEIFQFPSKGGRHCKNDCGRFTANLNSWAMGLDYYENNSDFVQLRKRAQTNVEKALPASSNDTTMVNDDFRWWREKLQFHELLSIEHHWNLGISKFFIFMETSIEKTFYAVTLGISATF